MALTLVVGTKSLSSWSLRAWLMVAATGAPFEEVVIPLDRPDTRSRIREHSPAGRVPVLRDGALTVWDSLAIGEYLAERFPAAGLWPADAAARAEARSISAEMHAGFAELRGAMPMDLRRDHPGEGRTPEAEADIARIIEIWNACRDRYGDGGPFLFGGFTIADAMYAPVATRFATYGVALDGAAAEYCRTLLALPAMRQWREAAQREG